MKQPKFTKTRLKIVFSQRTLRNVVIAGEFCYWMGEIGLKKVEVKMDFRIGVKGVKEKLEKERKRENRWELSYD